MARPQRSKAGTKVKILAENRKARHEYFLQDTMEAGIVLTGTEVKSLRFGSGNIADSYAEPKGGEIHLVNAHIPEFKQGNRHNHEPRRVRRLLLHKREIAKLSGAVQRQGMTIVPLCLYFNDRGKVKLEIALAKGKKAHDKRETIKQRDWQRQKSRLLKDHG